MNRDVRWLQFRKYKLTDCENQIVNMRGFFCSIFRLRYMNDNVGSRMMNGISKDVA